VVAKKILVFAFALAVLHQAAYGQPDISLASDSHSLGNGKWEWTAFVRAKPDILGRIVCVEYTLDPTFPDPSRLVCEKGADSQAFGLTTTAWGDFNLSATIIFMDRSTRKLPLSLKFQGGKPPSHAGITLHVKVVNRLGMPIPGAAILILSPDGRYVSGVSDSEGGAALEFFDQNRPTVLCANPGFVGSFRSDVDPGQPVVFELAASRGGSIIIENGTGYITGLEGRLNPILDSQRRSYIYADNIAIEGNPDQPFSFTLGRPFRVMDSKGRAFSLTVIAMRGRSFLINYIPEP
jgi:hypothetical protein